MKNTLPKKWLKNLDILDIAFQPILNMHSGKIFAVEALIRNYEEIGFKSIFALFDTVYEENILYSFDIKLREKAIKKFTTIPNYKELKLFFNLDNRLLQMPDFTDGNTNVILKEHNVLKENFCFEISERHEIKNDCNIEEIIAHYKNDDFCIAIDDFGVGYSGYKLLYDSTPNIIKIDRFFLQNIHQSNKKKIMLKSISNLAMQLGIKIIAEGVETNEEFLTCKDIGCHYVQGYLIQKPTKNVSKIHSKFEHITDLIELHKRSLHASFKIKSKIDHMQTIELNTKMDEVIDYFKRNKLNEIAPVVNKQNFPLGIIEEKQIKDYLYTPYGRAILLNNQNKSKLKKFLKPCPSADISSDISTIMEIYSNNEESTGVIITYEDKYYGFLSSRSIIEVMYEKNLQYAVEQNPLTKLPGNMMIEQYINDIIKQNNRNIVCYFDLDNFKAFNDVYGFRNGDRVIQLFADIMKKELPSDFFKAHVGGDDFFCAVQDNTKNITDSNLSCILYIIDKFTSDVKEFYSQEDKNKGFISSKDREGNPKNFPLLTVSASVIIIEQYSRHKSIHDIHAILSAQKKVAKNELKHLSISSLL